MPEEVKKALDQFFKPGPYTFLTIGEYEVITQWFGIDFFEVH